MSCRGWSSDAYWAARLTGELTRRGHEVMLGIRAGSHAVRTRLQEEGAHQLVPFAFAGGVSRGDIADIRRLLTWWPRVDIVHVHRGKEHWLAAAANRLSGMPRPIVRTRHIVQAVRPHAANRWLYRHATTLVHTVSEAIRGQLLAAGLAEPDRVVSLPGGVDADVFSPGPVDQGLRSALGGEPGVPLIGLIAGLRVMKGHAVVVEAAKRLGAAGLWPRFTFIGRGSLEGALGAAVRQAGLQPWITFAGFVERVPDAMRVLDVGLYVPMESEGMSRAMFEYLAAGCPLVASRVGVAAEILKDREHAVIVPAGDEAGLTAALAELLRDGALRERLAGQGRRLVVERYSGARVAEALEAYYARLLHP